MSRIAIVAALPGELKPLVKGWQFERRGTVHLWRNTSGEKEIVAACAGAGLARATRAFAAAESFGQIDSVVSIGWAGALRADFEPGRAYRCCGVIDQKAGERFAAEGGQQNCWLITSPRVADEGEKRRLTLSYKAALVDMEAAAIARLAVMRQIPFICIKGVSDGFNDRLPDFNRFLSLDGQMQLGKLVVYALLHPACWPSLVRMGENSKRASLAMADAVRAMLANLGS
jgi:adenosylhomocysteine nucleosidase